MIHEVYSDNLVGDGLMLTPALRMLRAKFPKDIIRLYVREGDRDTLFKNNPHFDLCIQSANDLERIAKLFPHSRWEHNESMSLRRIRPFCVDAFNWGLQNQKMIKLPNGKLGWTGRHIAEGYATQMGCRLDSVHYDLFLTEEEKEYAVQRLEELEISKPLILVAPLSHSCTSRVGGQGKNLPANKMLSADVWTAFQAALSQDFDIRYLAAYGEDLLPIRGGTWIQGECIRTVAALCQKAAAVVSIDTGIGHVGQAVDANLVSICCAVADFLVSCSATKGKFELINTGPTGTRQGPSGVNPREIIEATLRVAS